MTQDKGNGNGKSTKDQLKGMVKIDDLVQVSIVAMFFVQKLGKASAGQVLEQIRGIHGEINEFLLGQALEALRARGLLSYARGTKTDGESIRMYKTTKVKWSSPPEVAHIKDLLPALVATDEAERIINILNDAEQVGDGTEKSKRKLGYAESWDIIVVFRLKNPILGSTPDSPWLRKIVKSSKIKSPEVATLRFWRDEENGDVIIPSDVVCGWIRTGIRYGLDLSETSAQYITADDVRIRPKEIFQVGLPVIDQKTKSGAGVPTYELIPKGEEITIYFRVPARGISDPLRFMMWLAAYAPRPYRGLSPARGRRFGKMEMISWDIIGAAAEAEKALTSIIDTLEDDRARKTVAKLLAMAADKKVKFTTPAKGGVKQSDLS